MNPISGFDFTQAIAYWSQVCSNIGTHVQKAMTPLQSFYRHTSSATQNVFKQVEQDFHAFVTNRALSLVPLPTQEVVESLHATALRILSTLPAEKTGTAVLFQRDAHIQLSGISITTTAPCEEKKQKWIVFFLPNGFLWEQQLHKLIQLSSIFKPEDQVNIISYNYRGRGLSTGSPHSEEEILQDGQAIVKDLLQRGILPENILLHGFSLGGGIATYVAARFADEGISLALCNERSFSSIPAVLKNRLPVIGALFGKLALEHGWTLDCSKVVLRLTGKVLVLSHLQDELILPPAQFITCAQSIAEEVVMTENQNEPLVERLINRIWSHGRPWREDEIERYVHFVKQTLKITG